MRVCDAVECVSAPLTRKSPCSTNIRNADAPTPLDGELVLAKPCEEDRPFKEFIEHLAAQEIETDEPAAGTEEVWYAQTRKSLIDALHVTTSTINHNEIQKTTTSATSTPRSLPTCPTASPSRAWHCGSGSRTR